MTDNFFPRVSELLRDRKFLKKRSSSNRLPMIQDANRIGGQRMMLIHSDAIDDLMRIPRSSEGKAEDAEEILGRLDVGRCEIFLLSHNWLR